MKSFDIILWRINGIILLLGLLAFIVCLTLFSLTNTPAYQSAAIVNVNKTTQKKEYLHLGNPSPFDGSQSVRLPLSPDDSSETSSSFSSRGYSYPRNYLFIDCPSLQSRWLLPDFTSVIFDSQDFSIKIKDGNSTATGSVYLLADKDTNGDGKITREDEISVVFATPDGKNSTTIANHLTAVASISQVNDASALLVYQRGDATFARLISIRTGEKINETKLPMQPSNP